MIYLCLSSYVQQYTRPCLLCCCLATCSSSRRRTRTKPSCLMTQVPEPFVSLIAVTVQHCSFWCTLYVQVAWCCSLDAAFVHFIQSISHKASETDQINSVTDGLGQIICFRIKLFVFSHSCRFEWQFQYSWLTGKIRLKVSRMLNDMLNPADSLTRSLSSQTVAV